VGKRVDVGSAFRCSTEEHHRRNDWTWRRCGHHDDELMTTAKYDWKFLICNIIRYYADDQMNQSKNAIMNLMQAKLKTAELSMIDKLETMGMPTHWQRGKDFMGLAGILKATFSGDTLGGVDANTKHWWQNKVKDCSGGSGDSIAD